MTVRTGLQLGALVLTFASGMLLQYRRTLRAETDATITAVRDLRTATTDANLQAEVDRIRVLLERSRVRASSTVDPHLALAITDRLLTLERGDIVLRSATVAADVPRGVHRIELIGPRGITLGDGIMIYAASAGENDSTPARPNGIRLSRADYSAILPNVKVGLTAYFF